MPVAAMVNGSCAHSLGLFIPRGNIETDHGNAARMTARRLYCYVSPQLAARRFTLLSASLVSFWSVAFSSSSVLASTLAQSLRPSCLAQAIRLP